MTTTAKKSRTASWHCYHDHLCGWDTTARQDRIADIRKYKPEGEIALRLKLFHPMSAVATALLPAYNAAVKRADALLEKRRRRAQARDYKRVLAADAVMRAAKGRARENAGLIFCNEKEAAWQEYKVTMLRAEEAALRVKTRARAALEARHKIECPNCPWNGETIFP